MSIRLIDALLILLLIFLPLALGAVHPWSITLFAIISVILFNLILFQPGFSFKKLFRIPVVIFSAIFLGYLFLQLIPLLPNILKAASPNTYKLYCDYSLTYPWINNWRPLSIYPWLSISELIKLISYGLIFLVILCRSSIQNNTQEIKDDKYTSMTYLQLGCLTGVLAILLHSLVDFNLHITANAFYFTVLLGIVVAINRKDEGVDRSFILKITNSIIFIGFIIGIFGILYKLSGNHKIYWVIEKDGYHFGPYIDYDHYAGFMGMCSSLAIASFMAKVRYSSFFLIKGFKNKLTWFSTKEASYTLRQLFYLIVMAGSLFYSSSRGGILSFIIAILIFCFLVIIRTKRTRRGRLAFFFILMLLLSITIIFWIGPDGTFEKFVELNTVARSVIHEPSVLSEIRPQIWSDVIKIIPDFYVTGTGFGTFSSIFPKYRTHEWEGEFLRYAHCDYLQLVSETGIVGLFSILGFLIYFVRLYVFALRKLK
jgi:O-Antigen ligase